MASVGERGDHLWVLSKALVVGALGHCGTPLLSVQLSVALCDQLILLLPPPPPLLQEKLKPLWSPPLSAEAPEHGCTVLSLTSRLSFPHSPPAVPLPVPAPPSLSACRFSLPQEAPPDQARGRHPRKRTPRVLGSHEVWILPQM